MMSKSSHCCLKNSQFVTLSPETFIGLGTGKFEVKFKTGVVAACCPAKLSSGEGMSSSYFVLFSKLCSKTCFHLLRPTFQPVFLMIYDDFYSLRRPLSLSFYFDTMFRFYTETCHFLKKLLFCLFD